MENLSFEGGWQDIEIGQEPDGWKVEWINGVTPDGWNAFTPESRVLSTLQLPPEEWDDFILDGTQCFKVFKGNGACWFAFRQDVEVVPGAVCRFNVPVHLDVYEWDHGKVYPGLGEHAAEVRLGWSVEGVGWENVEWGDWCAPEYGNLEYGRYREIELSFASPYVNVTVWVECKAKWDNKSNNFFFDHLKFNEAIQACQPRVPYDRTYVLMDQAASLDDWKGAIERHYPYRRTIGASADDAFYGPGTGSRKVIAVNPSDPEGLEEFGEVYYPGAEFEIEGRDSLWQRDPRWTDHKLSGDLCYSTMGQVGCFITGVAEGLRYYQMDLGATPLSVDLVLGSGGYNGCDARWSAIEGELDLVISRPLGIDDELDNGKCGMAEVRIGGAQHFVFVYGRDGDRYRICDPWTGQKGWLDEGYEDVISWRLMEMMEQPVTSHTLVTGHISGSLPAIETYLRTAKPRGIKMIAWDVRNVYNWHPEIEAIILRKWYNTNPPNHYFLDHHDKSQAAKEYVDLVLGELPQEAQWLWDQGWRGRIGLESLNEPYCNLCEANAKARDFEIAFCHELMSRNIPLVVPACMNAGVGNPHHDGETEEIIRPVAEVLGQYRGFWCTHNYGPVWQGESHLEDQWEWYTGRVDWWLDILQENEVDLFFTEGGPITGPPPLYQPQEYGGWKSSDCYDGDWVATRGFLVRLNELLNICYGDRCYGNAIFATGESEQWDMFEMSEREWDDLAGYI